MWPVLSYARFLCNNARELLERDALKALDVGVLVEIAHHVHRRTLFIYELEQLAFIARVTLSLSLSAFSASFSLCDFGRASSWLPRRPPPLLLPQPKLVQASASYKLIMEAFGQLVTQKMISRTPLLAALHALEA